MLIDELDPAEFWQIHRSTVIRVDAVEQASCDFRGDQVVQWTAVTKSSK